MPSFESLKIKEGKSTGNPLKFQEFPKHILKTFDQTNIGYTFCKCFQLALSEFEMDLVRHVVSFRNVPFDLSNVRHKH